MIHKSRSTIHESRSTIHEPRITEFKTIVIVGLGLMGGSLGAACRRKFPKAEILGVSRDPLARRAALKKRWIHQGFADLKEAAASADLIVLCTPVDTFPKYLLRIDRYAKRGALVTDVGSVKAGILRRFARVKFKNIHYVPAHPMAGSHARGIAAARPDLYDGSFSFLIRTPGIPPKIFARAQSFWRKITPKLIEVTAGRHDRIVSRISHLPHAVAVCLALAPEKEALAFAASGFADTTRLAQGDPSVWLPIFQMNRREIQAALARFEKEFHRLKAALGKSDSRDLLKILKRASLRRRAASY